MTANVTCSACSCGDCGDCEVGRQPRGFMGGWRCVCPHDEQTRAAAREWARGLMPGVTDALLLDGKEAPDAR